MASVAFDMTKASNYLKVKYGPAGVLLYNSMTPVLAMVKKDYDWKGGNFEEPVVLSMGVGVGSGSSLPDAAVEQVSKVSFSDKNMYARTRIANKVIEKAVGGESAFIDGLKDRWEKTQKGWAWNIERALFAPTNGALGTIDTGGVSGTNPYTLTISAATWKQFNFEVGILCNVASGTDIFEVTSVVPASRQVVVSRQSGSQTPAQGEVVYMQNSKDNDIISIPTVVSATSGSLYGVTVGYRWQSHQQTSLSVTIDEELIDNAMLDIEANCGEGPDFIVTSRKQWKILKSNNTGLKRYLVENPNVDSKLKVKLGFTALEYISPVGSQAVPITYSRFCEDDRMYLLNTKKFKLKHTRQPHWFDADGTVFLRTPDNKDELEARWVAYMENYMYPTYHGYMAGLL